MSQVMDRTFDYIPRLVEANNSYLVRHTAVARELAPINLWTQQTWWSAGAVTDQGSEGACVGHGVTQEAMSSPVRVKLRYPDLIAHGVYRRAQQIDEWEGECVDAETQCLTRTGWKSGDELLEGEEILTFDTETETTRWAVVERVHRYTSKPYRIWGVRGFQVAATDNHRWPVRMRPNGSGFPRPFRMTTTAEWRSGDEILRAAPCSDLPTEPKWDDDLVELVAWVITEGHYRPSTRRGNGVVVSQKVHLDRVAELMARMGVAGGHLKQDGTHTWELSGDLARQVREIAPARATRVDWLASLTQRQLRLFLDVCTLADGCTTDQAGRQSRDTLGQKTGAILDGWLAAAALAGQPVSRAAQGSGSGGDVETWTLRRSGSLEVRQLRPSVYMTGPVWCPQTEVGTFIARRGGSIFITGNSYDGTSVRAGMLVGRDQGWWKSFYWAKNMDELRIGLELGPVVIGVTWREGMYVTTSAGLVVVNGPVVGGHCLLITGFSPNYNRTGPRFRWRNSWGRVYGLNGNGYVSPDDLNGVLFRDGNEAAVPEQQGYGTVTL